MKKTPAYRVGNVLTESERLELLKYLATDDDRTDARPDVRSKHPVWGEPGWPQHIINTALCRAVGPGFVIEDISFREDKIALKPHTDNGSINDSTGKTILLMLDLDPEAHTVFFKNYWMGWEKFGTFFTKTPFNRFAYGLPDRDGKIVDVDLREFLDRCKKFPESVTDFEVTPQFVEMIQGLICKRDTPKLDYNNRTKDTGYEQTGSRRSDYESLSDYDPDISFDEEFHRRYLWKVPIIDLHGLQVESVIEWHKGAAVVFDREQLHASSNCHTKKSFVTIFYHHPGR